MSLKQDGRPAALVIGATVAMLGLGVFGALSRGDRRMPPASRVENALRAAPSPRASAVEEHEERAPASVPPRPGVALTNEEEGAPTQREDVEAWVASGDASKLPALLAIDVSKDLEAAPAVIMGIAKFSRDAAPELKKKAASQLGQMLGSERTRAESYDMRGAAGNVATGIDALGEMATTEACAELLHALDSTQYALHHETRMVQELTTQKYTPARAAVERFAIRTKARVFEDSFDKELQKEALEAADEALTRMSK